MLIGELLDRLPQSGWVYEGRHDVEFTGLAVGYPKERRRDRFYAPRDASWPQAAEEPQRPSDKKTKQNLLRAIESGAAGVICSDQLRGSGLFEGSNVFYAADTFALVCDIVTLLREQLDRTRITGITGAVGKTSTRAMLMHALKASGDVSVFTEPGNRNWHRPVLHGLSIAWKFDHTVLEISSAAFDVYRASSFAVSPDVAIVTAIAAAHLEHTGSVENVARMKSDIFLSPPPGGVAVVNGDTEFADVLIERARTEGYELVVYGESPTADVRLASWNPTTHETTAVVDNEQITYTLGPSGKHTALNSLAVLAALRAHGVGNWREAMQSLSAFQPQSGRGDVHELTLPAGGKITLINESYNANPGSIRSSLELLHGTDRSPGARRVALLGDVLELGDHSEQVHRALSRSVLEFRPDQLFLFGPHMRALRDELQGQGQEVHHWNDLESVKTDLAGLLLPEDVVLMKASGGTGLYDWVSTMIKSGAVFAVQTGQ